jgi:hypothetical protein
MLRDRLLIEMAGRLTALLLGKLLGVVTNLWGVAFFGSKEAGVTTHDVTNRLLIEMAGRLTALLLGKLLEMVTNLWGCLLWL